jgi:hypothetical protein
MASTLTLILAAFASSPVDPVVIDRVDLIEINHYYDDGRHVLDQSIFYDWNSYDKRFQIRDWRPLKGVAQVPHFDWQRAEYVARWWDGGVMREVRAKNFRETWTRHDPEFVERNFLPKKSRKLLSPSTDFSMAKLAELEGAVIENAILQR